VAHGQVIVALGWFVVASNSRLCQSLRAYMRKRLQFAGGISLLAALIGTTVSAQIIKPMSEGKTNSVPATVHPLKAKGIENFYQLSDRVFSGSVPDGEAAFAALKERGIKTIITVDGSQPDVETAKRFGIRYVHLPIGYDAVPTNQAARMIKAAESLPGPIYVHCHHGLHRGPAGAAVICMGVEGWTTAQADAWMHLAGTATNYAGLYTSVERFRPPSAEALAKLSADFPEKSKVSPLADVMIQMDEHFDNMKLIRKSGFQKPASHPDLEPAHEALLFSELFKELKRTGITEKRGDDFKAKLDEAVRAAGALSDSLNAKPADMQAAEKAFLRVGESCAACHKAHRN
jgi:protein tyrosine phosphatase (PTP) superfamily phosphohydrolase (DUF442 family)